MSYNAPRNIWQRMVDFKNKTVSFAKNTINTAEVYYQRYKEPAKYILASMFLAYAAITAYYAVMQVLPWLIVAGAGYVGYKVWKHTRQDPDNATPIQFAAASVNTAIALSYVAGAYVFQGLVSLLGQSQQSARQGVGEPAYAYPPKSSSTVVFSSLNRNPSSSSSWFGKSEERKLSSESSLNSSNDGLTQAQREAIARLQQAFLVDNQKHYSPSHSPRFK